MAIAEYYVIADQAQVSAAKTAPQPKWNGAAAESEVLSLKSSILATINAESTLEAIHGFRQLYPGWVKTKCIAVEKAVVEEV